MNKFEHEISQLPYHRNAGIRRQDLNKVIRPYIENTKFASCYRDTDNEHFTLQIIAFVFEEEEYAWMVGRDVNGINSYQLEKRINDYSSKILASSRDMNDAVPLYAGVVTAIKNNKLIKIA